MLASSSPNSFIQCPLQLASSKTTLGKQLPYTTPPRLRFRSLKTSAACSATTETGRRPQLNFRTDQMASAASLYEVLGIPMSASCHEIKAAYRKLARMCHPDVVAINHKETSASEFIKIHAAYSTLSDPEKRACYDREIYSHRLRPCSSSTMASAAAMATAMSGFSGRTRRNWETDQCW